jgi:hypothetical protein
LTVQYYTIQGYRFWTVQFTQVRHPSKGKERRSDGSADDDTRGRHG